MGWLAQIKDVSHVNHGIMNEWWWSISLELLRWRLLLVLTARQQRFKAVASAVLMAVPHVPCDFSGQLLPAAQRVREKATKEEQWHVTRTHCMLGEEYLMPSNTCPCCVHWFQGYESGQALPSTISARTRPCNTILHHTRPGDQIGLHHNTPHTKESTRLHGWPLKQLWFVLWFCGNPHFVQALSTYYSQWNTCVFLATFKWSLGFGGTWALLSVANGKEMRKCKCKKVSEKHFADAVKLCTNNKNVVKHKVIYNRVLLNCCSYRGFSWWDVYCIMWNMDASISACFEN